MAGYTPSSSELVLEHTAHENKSYRGTDRLITCIVNPIDCPRSRFIVCADAPTDDKGSQKGGRLFTTSSGSNLSSISSSQQGSNLDWNGFCCRYLLTLIHWFQRYQLHLFDSYCSQQQKRDGKQVATQQLTDVIHTSIETHRARTTQEREERRRCLFAKLCHAFANQHGIGYFIIWGNSIAHRKHAFGVRARLMCEHMGCVGCDSIQQSVVGRLQVPADTRHNYTTGKGREKYRKKKTQKDHVVNWIWICAKTLHP